MLKADYHRCLRTLISSLNASFLAENNCFLSGATPIVLSLGEYRAADGLAVACFGRDGYRHIREEVSPTSLGQIFLHPIELGRPVRADRFGIRTYVMIGSTPIHFELYKEDRFGPTDLDCSADVVPTLSRDDMFVERLLTNADQYRSSTKVSAPVVDLAIMVANWGEVPEDAWKRAQQAYGPLVTQAYVAAVSMLSDADDCSRYVHDLSVEAPVDQTLLEIIPKLLSSHWCRDLARHEGRHLTQY